jgi:membrane-bound lytic murein transglycosylase A
MTSVHGRSLGLARSGSAAIIAVALTLASPAFGRNPLKLPDTQYEPIRWPQIEGWADDDHDASFAAFRKSCSAVLQATPSARESRPMLGALYKTCQKAANLQPSKPGEARLFFEQNFRPVRISPLGSSEGFVTGYYEPIVEGMSRQADGYDYPLYRKPHNLLPGGRMAVTASAAVSTEENGSKKKKRGLRRRFVAFFDRARIEDGALAGRDLEICWLKNPIDPFFAQIQGSVRVLLDDGRLMRLNYAAANGQPYYAVGRDLIARNIISKDEMSMDRIRQWMERNPESGRELMRKNKSYVFFRETNLREDQEPIGAQGVSLTPGRSIAVDRKLHVYGTPFFISAHLPIEGLNPDTWFRRLMIAQDTGGAIVGPARADIYFGAGNEAESIAGRLRHNGKFVMLLPKELGPEPVDDEIPLPRPRPAMLIANAPGETPQEPAAPAAPSPASATPSAPAAKPEAKKPAAKTVAAKSADPAPDKAPERKTEKNIEKKKQAKAEKPAAAAKADPWESRVMPIIVPDAPAKTSQAKTSQPKTSQIKKKK